MINVMGTMITVDHLKQLSPERSNKIINSAGRTSPRMKNSYSTPVIGRRSRNLGYHSNSASKRRLKASEIAFLKEG